MHWTPNPLESGKPRYLAIADAIARDIRTGQCGVEPARSGAVQRCRPVDEHGAGANRS